MSGMINNLKKLLGVSAAVSLGATMIPATSIAAPKDASFEMAQAQIAQAQTCREVEAEPGLNIRTQPWKEVIASVRTNEYVYLENPSPQGQDWVQIQSPMNGYVAASYLSYCTGAASAQQPVARYDQPLITTEPGQMEQPVAQSASCREISSPTGLSVRSLPQTDSEIMVVLPDNTQVEIESLGEDGWVSISDPVQGYVDAEELTMCSQ